MICSAKQMIVAIWNTTLGWNGLNKRESIMKVIIKVNPIQDILSEKQLYQE